MSFVHFICILHAHLPHQESDINDFPQCLYSIMSIHITTIRQEICVSYSVLLLSSCSLLVVYLDFQFKKKKILENCSQNYFQMNQQNKAVIFQGNEKNI